MGIPKFFRWAGDRYQGIVSGVIGEDGGALPHVDNLYIDMNGVIHNCSHGDDSRIESSKSTTAILASICEWLHYIVTELVKPQRLVYLAVDGVAPRAKLNQQRARRFRAATERLRQLEEARATGHEAVDPFDSNCITPGTTFMVEIGLGIRAFLVRKMQEDPVWAKLEVIFSGCEVPGEGEHKLISYMRDQKAINAFPPNLRHCIYGADADMILLALATHEPYILILREVFEISKGGSRHPKKFSTDAATVSDLAAIAGAEGEPVSPFVHAAVKRKRMQAVRIHTLRECLIGEFGEALSEESFDGERFLDDFVFLTFLIGNDFLPHLPGIDIGDNAFEIIFDAYKTAYGAEQGYLVTDGKLDYHRLELIFHLIGVVEAVVFQEKEIARAARNERRQHRSIQSPGSSSPSVGNKDSTGASPTTLQSVSSAALAKLSVDEHRLLYYATKFHIQYPAAEITPTDGDALTAAASSECVLKEALRPVIREYLTGLTWCLAYYTQGCTSWSWYYPYHYGIFLQDMTNLAAIAEDIHLDLGTPLRPFQQLLACLPPASAYLLPPVYKDIMTSEASPLKDMYPLTFATDLNGKKNDYEAVVLLPFIDVAELIATETAFLAQDNTSTIREGDVARNTFGSAYRLTTVQHRAIQRLEVVVEALTTSWIPGTCFAPRVTEGTLPTLPGYPNLSTIQAGRLFGRTMYIGNKNGRGGNGNTRGSQGDNRPGKGRANGREGNGKGTGRGAAGGRNSGYPRKNRATLQGSFGIEAEASTAAFPMPGWTMVPSLSTYYTSTTSTDAHSSVHASRHPEHQQEDLFKAPLTINFVLDSQSEQFLAAITLQIQQQVPAFTSFSNLPLGTISFHPSTITTSIGETEYSKIVCDLSALPVWQTALRHLHHQQELPEHAQAKATANLLIAEVIQKVAEVFGPLQGRLTAQTCLLPLPSSFTASESDPTSSSVLVALVYEDNSHLDQIEDFLASRWFTTTTPAISIPRCIVLGTFTGPDAAAFAAWLSNELAKFTSLFPPFTCAIIEGYGAILNNGNDDNHHESCADRTVVEEVVVDIQCELSGASALSS